MMKKRTKILLLLTLFLLGIGAADQTVYATGEENPRVMIEEYTTSDEEIVPGQEFELELKLRDTSEYYDVYSVVVTVNDKTDSVYPVYGKSNQVYIDRIYARNYTTITIPMQASETITDSAVPIEITITYNDNYFVEKQSNSTILYLPIKMSGNLNVISCSVPESSSTGTKARVSVSYENTGLKSLSNIQLHVVTQDGADLVTDLYSLSGGSTNSADIYLECSEKGNMPVCVYFTYQDDTGEAFETDEQSYTIRVVESNEDENGQKVVVVGSKVDYFTFILMAAIIAVAFVILVTLKKRRR